MNKSKDVFHNDVIYQTQNKLNKSEVLFFQRPKVVLGVAIIAFLADFVSLFNIIDLKLTQSVLLSVLITTVISGVMNISPIIISKLMNDKENKSLTRKIQLISLLVLFISLFVISFALRWTTRADLFRTDTGIVISDVENTTTLEDEYEPTISDDVLAILLGLEPLGTSILVYALSNTDPLIEKKKVLKGNQLDLISEKHKYEVMVSELERELEKNLYEYDDKKYLEAVETVNVLKEYLMLHARQRLAERIGSAEAITYLMEEYKLREKMNLEDK
jgi:ABC-type polysaccharide transport system, permease component